ncbi:MAG: hypothetical protein QM753_14990 [Thermomicrobiales bacterium]
MNSRTESLFIRAADRPDLRAVFAETPEPSDADPCVAALPRPLRFSGCNEKSDKADKTKEVGKDDKAHRAPVRDRRAGQCTYLASAQHLDAPAHDFIFS